MTRAFPLQVVLEHRQRMEEMAQQELARLEIALRHEMAQLAELRRRAEADLQTLGVLQKQGGADRPAAGPSGMESGQDTPHSILDLEGIRLTRAHLQYLEAEISRKEQRILQLQQQVDDRRHSLTRLLQEKKALETLKERHQKRIMDEEMRRELRLMDDLAARKRDRSMK